VRTLCVHFKAARRAARAGRHGALAYAPACAPAAAAPTPGGWREAEDPWAAINVQQALWVSRGQWMSMLPLAILSGAGRTRQGRL
jgi:hypothetical protein